MLFRDVDELREAKKVVWDRYMQDTMAEPLRKSEIECCEMKYQDVTMKYGIQVIGEPGESGYPVYIALHGGGQSDTPDINNQQWEHMGIYYKGSVKDGIYINPRGIRDTWDTHANPESYLFYDRLIQNLILFYPVDANRIYLLGFSAGGDGVYMIGPRMADRFAAVHMSAGHPNGTSVHNLYNTPIQLQVGINDDAYDRNKVTVEYGQKLDALETEYGAGYPHNVYVHTDHGHNFRDNSEEEQFVLADHDAWLQDQKKQATIKKDTNAVNFLCQYTRNPIPETIVWDLGNRADLRECSSFYWLQATKELTEGIIQAQYAKEENRISIKTQGVKGNFYILLNENMMDLFRPITIETVRNVYSVQAEPSFETLVETTQERGDSNFQFVVKILVQV